MSVQVECMFDAVRTGNLRAFCILKSLYDIDINDNSCYNEYYAGFLHVAVMQSNLKMVKTILKLGANIHIRDYYGVTPLYIAIENKVSIDIIKILLVYGADIYDVPLGLVSNRNVIDMTKSIKLNDEYYKVLIPYTNGHKKWKKIKILVKVFSMLRKSYWDAVDRVWSPNGSGFLECQDHFYNLLLK